MGSERETATYSKVKVYDWVTSVEIFLPMVENHPRYKFYGITFSLNYEWEQINRVMELPGKKLTHWKVLSKHHCPHKYLGWTKSRMSLAI